MRIAYDQQAIVDLENIHNYIASSSATAAKRVIDRLMGDIDQLGRFPKLGRVRSNRVREWVVPRLPYVIVYEIDEVVLLLTVTAVFHVARDR